MWYDLYPEKMVRIKIIWSKYLYFNVLILIYYETYGALINAYYRKAFEWVASFDLRNKWLGSQKTRIGNHR